MIKTGFTLIESLIYLFCTLLIISFFLIFMQNIYKTCNDQVSKINNNLDFFVAVDQLTNDLRSLDTNSKYWPNLTGNKLLYKSDKKNYSWFLKDNKLIKSVSYFDFKESKWNKPAYSLLMENTKSFGFNLIKNKENKILGIKISISSFSCNLDMFVGFTMGQVL